MRFSSITNITRRFFLSSLAAASCLAMASVSTAQAETNLRLAIPDPISSSVGTAATKFAEYVKEETDGEVQFTIFSDGVLFGKDQNAAINQLGLGALDGLILAASVYASFEPRMNAMGLPFLFEDYDQFQAYLHGEIGGTLLQSLEKMDIVGLDMFLRTFRNVTTRETPITKLADFNGLKLRTPNNPMYVRLFQQLGANPTPMAFSEVYSALQLKVIDGQENPVEVPLNNKFNEVQGHLNITNHMADAFLLALSQKAWDQIPAEYHDAVRAASRKMVLEHDAAEIEAELQIIDQLQDLGMQVNHFEDGERDRVREEAMKIYGEFEEQIGADFMQQSIDFVSK